MGARSAATRRSCNVVRESGMPSIQPNKDLELEAIVCTYTRPGSHTSTMMTIYGHLAVCMGSTAHASSMGRRSLVQGDSATFRRRIQGLGPVSDLSGSARGSAGLVQLAWFARGDGARSCCGVGRPCSTGGFSGAGLALQKEHALGHTHNKVGVRV